MPGYVALYGGLIGKDLEGSDSGVIDVFFSAFILRTLRKRRKSMKFLGQCSRYPDLASNRTCPGHEYSELSLR